ncbi:NAD(P)/FAD-dependent oxidoreductase [Natrialbaceae archaeon GCM10025810]|uniref:NAD(P)/FAD-dependent oxidoreductase n=1 Tax=Halovalidus salilacus TaxID=3075124 RepID=UPI0036191F74
MTHVGIVGAGVAGAAAAFTLEGAPDDVAITVLEESNRVGGRTATRRRNGTVFDYGANYAKSDDDRVAELLTETLSTDGLVDVSDPIWTFDRDGRISEGRDADEHKWTYRNGVSEIATRLLERADATVRFETPVETIRRIDDAWLLEDADGIERGPFDAVLLSPPAPETARLVRSAEWGADVRGELADALEAVPFRTIFSGALHYPFELERPYYALVNADKAHEIGWIAREGCKPGHVPDGETLLIVQANHEWSVAHAETDPDESLDELAALTAGLLGDERLREPDWSAHRLWRHALPEGGVAKDPIRRAEADGLYCLGDWVAGEGRIHAAVRTGLEVADRIGLER